jgi:hypothetical protein
LDEYKYYKNTISGSIYRTCPIKFNTGEDSLRVERFNWDFKNWNGHIHDHDVTRYVIANLLGVVEVTKDEIDSIISQLQ